MKKLLLFFTLFTSFNLSAQSNNYSLEFDAVNDYISFTNPPISTQLNEGSFATYVQFNDTIWGSNGDWIFNGSSSNTSYIGLGLHTTAFFANQNFRFGFYINNTWEFATSSVEPIINQWYHLVGTWGPNGIQIYVDAILTGTNPYAGSIPLPNDMVLGSIVNQAVIADISSFEIWDRALTQQEIQGYMICPPIGNEIGLVGYWNFEEGSGNTTADQTANGNNCTLNGAVNWITNVPPYNCCTPNPITSQPTDQTVNIGDYATFVFTDSLTVATYQWQMDAGTGYSDLSNAGQFSGTDSDSLIISTTTMSNNNTNYRCIITESANCIDTTVVANLTVIDNTSISELNNSLVKLFPNPSNGIITITIAQHSNGQIILTDILGKELLSKSFNSNEVKLNLKSLESKGTYFAKVLDSIGNVIAIKKLIYQ